MTKMTEMTEMTAYKRVLYTKKNKIKINFT